MSKAPQEIRRYPLLKNDPLQGWDSADELILQHMKTLDLTGKKILILCDHFGALSCGLEEFQPTTYTDSYVSAMGIKFNTDERIAPLQDLSKLQGIYDFIIIHIPKNLSFFEDLLCQITNHVNHSSQIICASMVKHLSPGSFDLLNRIIGPTTTSLAQKKARLIFARFEKTPIPSPYPQEVKIEGFELSFTHQSNLFSREKLDIGTRFFLEHIPQGEFETILDLGCANGIVGIRAQQKNPGSQIIFSDDSAMAIESARANYQKFFGDKARFEWVNCYENGVQESLDLVLCNPPFHQQNTVGDFIALAMFKDAFRTLKKGGLIRVIGNSHLAYQVKLKTIFGNSKIIATNNKFMIIDARKT